MGLSRSARKVRNLLSVAIPQDVENLVSLRSVEVVHPGEYLSDEIRERRWAESDLATYADLPYGYMQLVLCGAGKVTPEAAVKIGRALGTSPGLWLNLQAAWDNR